MSQFQDHPYLTKDSFFVFKHQYEQHTLFLNYELLKPQAGSLQEIQIHISYFPSENNILRVLKCSSSEEREISFLTSCLPLIRKSFHNLKTLQKQIDNQGLNETIRELDFFKISKSLNKMKYCSELLYRFLTNQEIPTKIDLEVTHKINKQRQDILRELFLIDVFLKLLELLLTQEEIKQEWF